MNLILTRQRYLKTGIFGKLANADESFKLFTLEHAFGQPDGTFLPILPKGQYACELGLHQLSNRPDKFFTFEVTNVPGHTGILFHKGNVNGDSIGCILLGNGVEYDINSDIANVVPIGLMHSAIAFAKFISVQGELQSFTLDVI